MENWKAIPGYEGKYEVSNLGRVRSLRGTRGGILPVPRMLRQCGGGRNGVYLEVHLWRDNQEKHRYVHELVLTAFRGPSPDPDVIESRHLNGVFRDNRLENLEWAHVLVNARDRIRHGTQARGQRIAQSKLDESKVADIRQLYATGRYAQHELATRFGVCQMAVSKIVRRVNWTHVSA